MSAFPGAGAGARERQQLSPAILALALTLSFFSALSLYHTLALKAEVAVLRTEVLRRREEQQSPAARLSWGRGEVSRRQSPGEISGPHLCACLHHAAHGETPAFVLLIQFYAHKLCYKQARLMCRVLNV